VDKQRKRSADRFAHCLGSLPSNHRPGRDNWRRLRTSHYYGCGSVEESGMEACSYIGGDMTEQVAMDDKIGLRRFSAYRPRRLPDHFEPSYIILLLN
jgi:hypothetical protein